MDMNKMIDNPEFRKVIFSLMRVLNKDYDGDFIRIDNIKYFVDASRDLIKIQTE